MSSNKRIGNILGGFIVNHKGFKSMELENHTGKLCYRRIKKTKQDPYFIITVNPKMYNGEYGKEKRWVFYDEYESMQKLMKLIFTNKNIVW